MTMSPSGAEHERLATRFPEQEGWKAWGPYLSERQWGTVREDYSPYGNARCALALLEGLASHLDEACSGTISEIMDGNPPHAARGCFAQAWSVSETLRAYHSLTARRARTTAQVAEG